MPSDGIQHHRDIQQKADELWDYLATMPMETRPDPSDDIAPLDSLIRRYPDATRRIIYLIKDGQDG